MTTDRAAQLLADGFERLVTFGVGVPHFVWKVDLEIEFDRDLRLIEETVLKLVQANVGDPTQMAALMGLAGQPIVSSAVVNLLRLGGLTQRDDRLWLTPFGAQMLERATTREVRPYTDVELRHDPYRDELRWRFDDDDQELKENELRNAGLRGLANPGALTQGDLVARYRDIQAILERDGLPFDNKDEKARKRRREILRVQPQKHYVAYREATLEVWYRRDRDEWRWRLLRGGGEEREISAKLEDLEAQGVIIIPLEDRRDVPKSQSGELVHAALDIVQTQTKRAIIEGAQLRETLREAIFDARAELIVVSPWLSTAAVDHEILGWIATSLDKHRELRVTIGYGIDRDPGRKPDSKTRDQEDALRRLRKVEHRSKGRLRLVDIGNTHSKVVLCDDRYCIITSYNWLSFKQRPGKGIRQEIGNRIVDAAVIAQLKASVIGALTSPGRAT
jgi:hypothetical protein